ncbi:uncharacterized protein LOC123969344 isoform X1 [Scomber scombrus]|uniref:Uncharacterized protein LOC123969344 isoform X1 n=1 Tax=Scomber scombrus TaxID=13677 RepID=A0AAV1N1N3_SCOSC
MGLSKDEELACVLMDSYCWAKSSENRLEQPLKRSSSTETCDSLYRQYPLVMSSPNRVETSVQSSENRTEPEKEDAAVQRQKNPDKWTTENKENREIQDEDQEFSTSLSVGDGHFLVDLGSSSEFIIDEECILQLFKSCRECSKQCTVRKTVKGLKFVVSQACCFCDSRYKWTNLPSDDDEDDGQNQKGSAS